MSPVCMEKLESSIRLVLTFNEAFNRHDVDGMMKLMSADCVLENAFPAPAGTVYARAKAVRFWQELFRPAPTLTKFLGWDCAGAANGARKMAARGTFAA